LSSKKLMVIFALDQKSRRSFKVPTETILSHSKSRVKSKGRSKEKPGIKRPRHSEKIDSLSREKDAAPITPHRGERKKRRQKGADDHLPIDTNQY